MAGPSWLIDGNRFATKIKCASGCDAGKIKWKSNPTRSCPSCQCTIDNSDDQPINFQEDHDTEFTTEVEQPKTQKQPDTTNLKDEQKATSESITNHQVTQENDNQVGEESLWDSESQYLLNSQQLAEGLSLCADLFQSQSPPRDENANDLPKKKSILSEYALLGPENLKKDLEECQNLVLDSSNIDLDTPPEFRLSQLEFGSQESFGAWGLDKVCD